MKKTIITCLGVSSIALTGVFYADQVSSRKHTSPVNTQTADASVGNPAAPDSSGTALNPSQSGMARAMVSSGPGAPPASLPAREPDPSPDSDTTASAATVSQNNNPTRQQGPASSNATAGGLTDWLAAP
jgi:hypothetical protein